MTVRFTEEDGQTFEVRRSRTEGFQMPIGELANRLCDKGLVGDGWPETLMRTTLIRDETLAALSLDLPGQQRFAAVRSAIEGVVGKDFTQRTSALLRAATAAKSDQEIILREVQAELGNTLSALTEARSIAESQPDIEEANRIIKAFAPDVNGSPAERGEAIRKLVAVKKRSLEELARALDRAIELDAERKYFDSEGANIEERTARSELAAAKDALLSANNAMQRATDLDAEERASDAFASNLVALIDHGTAIGLQDGHCPLCDAVAHKMISTRRS